MRAARLAVALVPVLLGLALQAAPASAAEEFGRYDLESVSTSLGETQAGAHADLTISVRLTQSEGRPYANTSDLFFKLPAGEFGNPQAVNTCTAEQFGNAPDESRCPVSSQVGITGVTTAGTPSGTFIEPIYNMTPPAAGNVVARLGFFAAVYPVLVNARLDPDDHRIVASVEGAPAAARLVAASSTLWGVPADPSHDQYRLTPQEAIRSELPVGGRPAGVPAIPFMTNPTECGESRELNVTAVSYQLPGELREKSAPFPPITGCALVGFNPTTALRPTTSQGTTGSGLDYELDEPTKGLEFPNLLYDSELKRAEVILPEGMTINPSEATGLGVCSEADLARESYDSGPNVGCPETSKIGSVIAETPVLDRTVEGSLYIAKPYQNPFGSLVALYMVLKVPDRGVLVKLAGEVHPNPITGQLITTFDDVPQLPVGSFELHFREGARAPLITPPACGLYTAVSNLTPWAAPGSPLARAGSFQIDSGPGHGPCPSGGLPPFHPGLSAYSANPVAGAFSPFDVKITRTDAEQEITHFSIKLPPGVTGKLAGIPFCSDLQIAAAKAREGQPHGGEEEAISPSCPAASQVGTSWAGAGVGDVLTYVPGKVYLAGPYKGSNLSIVSITEAKAGPFDLGTVVVREALRINPETAEVFVDAAGSDPIPHIVDGIPVHLRDIRAYVDRPEFMLNPTSCEPTSTASTVLGSGLDFASEADDRPITVTSRFQVADCASLGFGPRIKLMLKGATKRTGLPRLKAVVRPRPGDANIGRAVVTLPKSEFLEQGHIGTTCTRVQFNAGGGNGERCPAKSVYGRAVAVTPILDEPLTGPVFLRSNGGERKLPDLVAALHTKDIDIDVLGFIKSLHPKGASFSRIRSIFASVPDAPVSRFTLEMFGGRKGLLINSVNLCKGRHRAISNLVGQNGKRDRTHPAVRVRCGRKGKRHHRKAHDGHSRHTRHGGAHLPGRGRDR